MIFLHIYIRCKIKKIKNFLFKHIIKLIHFNFYKIKYNNYGEKLHLCYFFNSTNLNFLFVFLTFKVKF